MKSCGIVYGPREKSMSQCSGYSLSSSGTPTVSNKIIIPLQIIGGVGSYCYLLIASIGSLTIQINGTFTIGIIIACTCTSNVNIVSLSAYY